MPLYIVAVAIMIIADQLVKHWAFTTLQAQHTIPLIENVFHLTYIENRGAAFSMFARFDSRWIFVALAVVISVIIGVVLSKKIMQTATGRWSLVLIAAGAIGIGITLLLILPLNAIIRHLSGLSGVAALPAGAAVILVAISMLLTFLAGLIPSRIAAKKDPVIALRSE